jgi:hypothetical protein
MRLPKGLPVCFSAILFALTSIFAQQSSDCLQRTVLVGIVDDRGVVPGDLTSNSFSATYGRRPVTSLTTVYSEGPRRVMVLLDTSGSMRGPEAKKRYPKWEIARAAARSLLASLPAGSAAGLITFTDKIDVRAPLSVDRHPAEEWLGNEVTGQVVSLRGPTAMYAAIEAAKKQLEPTQPGDSIYIITDGGENASRIAASKVERSLVFAGVRLFAFLVNSSGLETTQTIDGTSELRLLVTQSGGFMQVVWPGKALTQAVPAFAWTNQDFTDSGLAYDAYTSQQINLHTDLLSRWISAFYLITFETPEGKPKHFDVKLVDPRGHARKDLTMAYSHTLPACATVTAQH